jgi:hypothetical protein
MSNPSTETTESLRLSQLTLVSGGKSNPTPYGDDPLPEDRYRGDTFFSKNFTKKDFAHDMKKSEKGDPLKKITKTLGKDGLAIHGLQLGD